MAVCLMTDINAEVDGVLIRRAVDFGVAEMNERRELMQDTCV